MVNITYTCDDAASLIQSKESEKKSEPHTDINNDRSNVFICTSAMILRIAERVHICVAVHKKSGVNLHTVVAPRTTRNAAAGLAVGRLVSDLYIRRTCVHSERPASAEVAVLSTK